MTSNLSQQISKYQAKQKQFLNQRKNVLRSLSSIRKNQRYFKNQNQYPPYHPQNNNHNQGQDRIRKIRKLNSDQLNTPSKIQKVASESQLPASESKNQIQSSSKLQQIQQKQVKVPQKIQQRNKRMFGNLSKHLKIAKNDLQTQQEKIRRKTDIEQKVKEKLVQQTKNMNQQKKLALAKKKQMQTKKKDQISKQLLKIQNSLLQAKYFQYLEYFNKYIPTKTEPVVYWKPAKQNDNIKKQLLENTQILKTKQESITKLIRSIAQPIQYSKLMVQNQNEYLNNKVDKYFKNQLGNLITETKPGICWRPIKWNQNLRKIQEKSKLFFQEKRRKIEIGKTKTKEQSQQQIESDSEVQDHSNKQQLSK